MNKDEIFYKTLKFTKCTETKWNFTPHFVKEEMQFISYIIYYNYVESSGIKIQLIKAPLIFMN